LKKVIISGSPSNPGSELRQRQLERSRRLVNTVRQEFSRSRARRPAIARGTRAGGITT
jgi:hypothetical protein